MHERLPVRVHCRDGVEADRPRGRRWFCALALICTACDAFVICFLLFERSEFLIATCKKIKTDRLCLCSAELGFSVENCLGFSVGYQRAPGWF